MSVKKALVFLCGVLCAQTPRPPTLRVDRMIALVIGNGQYATRPLANATRDAEAVAARLRTLGFDVRLRENLGIREMGSAVEEFAGYLQQGDLAFFYYSGEAVQVRAQNYLIPVDLQPVREDQISYSAYSVSRLANRIEQTGARVRVIALDACRDYPLQRSGPQVSGLATMFSNPGTLISYAAAPGRVSEVGAGVYTNSLLRQLSAPGATLRSVFGQTQSNVAAITGGRQVPYLNDRVGADVSLAGDKSAAPPPLSTGAAPPPVQSSMPPPPEPVGSAPPPVQSSMPPPPVQTSVPPVQSSMNDAPTSLAAGPEDRIVRFGNIEAPDQAPVDAEFSIVVSLTREKLTSETKVVSTGDVVDTTAEGALDFGCPQPCVVEAVLFAPGFDIVSGSNTTAFRLSADREAPPARFRLKSRPGIANATSDLTVDLWHKDAFIAKLKRQIGIGRPPAQKTEPRVTTAAVDVPLGTAPDLTVRWEERDVGGFHFCQVMVEAPGLTPLPAATCTPGEQIEKFLAQRYQGVLKTTLRGFVAPASANAPHTPQQVAAQLRGLGRELYDQFATANFRSALGHLRRVAAAKPGAPLTIQIDTNNPALPWELMVPCAGDECGFLGIDYEIARWHISDAAAVLSPQTIQASKIEVMAPNYSGGAFLPSQKEELATLAHMPGYQAVGGRLDDFRRAFQSPDSGILHFAGHGQSYQGYQIRMEDSPADPTMLRGWSSGGERLYFWNACDSGQENTVAGFVDGWAPALLDNGAAGFIGGLWPLGDAAAADFAERFYATMKTLEDHPEGAPVARLVQLGRRRFLDTGDPTYLAYVFYGDVRLRITR